MGPIHVAPNGALGIVLMEHVIASAEEDRTVGIVHPVACWQEMVLGAQRICRKFLLHRVGARWILKCADECRADCSGGGDPKE